MKQHIQQTCPSNPCGMEMPPHECTLDRLECVYCGVDLEQQKCNGCGQYLSTGAMHEYETRCEACR
jgi:hypothetical protein